MWTALSGAPRAREPAPGAGRARGRDAASVIQGARIVAVLASIVLLWGAGGAARFLLHGSVSAETVALYGMAPLALLGVVLGLGLALRAGPRSRGMLSLTSLVAGVFLLLAIAGHLLHARGASLRPFFPGGSTALDLADLTLILACLVVVPLFGGLFVRAAGRALTVTAASPWRPVLSDLDEERPHRRGGPAQSLVGLIAAWFTGLRLPGLLVIDILWTVAGRARDRLVGEQTLRMHMSADADKVEAVLGELGATVEATGVTTWRVTLARQTGMVADPVVRVTFGHLDLPHAATGDVIDVRGTPTEARRVHRTLENALALHGLVTWTRGARRMERAIHALAHEADDAHSLEERAALLGAVESIEKNIQSRAFLDDEWAALSGWKIPLLRERLRESLDGGSAQGAERPPLSPAPSLGPDLGSLMGAGGLAAASRLVYVPHHLVPVRTRRGEVEVVVNALTNQVDADESHDLLRALRNGAPTLRLAGVRPTVLPAPPATAALVGDVRAALRTRAPLRTTGEVGAVETWYIPFVADGVHWRNAITGREAEGMSDALMRAAPPDA